jgi:hypothetical protein
VEEGVRRLSLENQIEQLAWVVLRVVNRTQARGSTARLVVPRAPEVADEIGMQLTDDQFLSVEEYLLDHGYVVDADINLTWGAYTLTPAGLKWLETSLPESLLTDPMRDLSERSGEQEAFGLALQAELEAECRRMEEVERELDGESLGAPETAAAEQERATPRSSTGGPQEGAEPRSWWRRMFGA